MAAVSDIDGWDAHQWRYDTFQHFRCGGSRQFPDRIGLAQMSGIERTGPAPGDGIEPVRGLIFVADRVGGIGRLRDLTAAGHCGFV